MKVKIFYYLNLFKHKYKNAYNEIQFFMHFLKFFFSCFLVLVKWCFRCFKWLFIFLFICWLIHKFGYFLNYVHDERSMIYLLSDPETGFNISLSDYYFSTDPSVIATINEFKYETLPVFMEQDEQKAILQIQWIFCHYVALLIFVVFFFIFYLMYILYRVFKKLRFIFNKVYPNYLSNQPRKLPLFFSILQYMKDVVSFITLYILHRLVILTILIFFICIYFVMVVFFFVSFEAFANVTLSQLQIYSALIFFYLLGLFLSLSFYLLLIYFTISLEFCRVSYAKLISEDIKKIKSFVIKEDTGGVSNTKKLKR